MTCLFYSCKISTVCVRVCVCVCVCVSICPLPKPIKWQYKWAASVSCIALSGFTVTQKQWAPIAHQNEESEIKRMLYKIYIFKKKWCAKESISAPRTSVTSPRHSRAAWRDNLCASVPGKRAACNHLCACWPGSSSTQWAARRGGSLRRRASLLHLLLTFPVGQRACRSSPNYTHFLSALTNCRKDF